MNKEIKIEQIYAQVYCATGTKNGLEYNFSNMLIQLITTIISLTALIITIRQLILARHSLDATKKSIDEDKRSRQLSTIPKMSWVIEVQMRLDRWSNQLEEVKALIIDSENKREGNILKEIVSTIPKHPNGIGIDAFVYKNMPDPLREIMMSGAQYFYNAISPATHLWSKESGPNWIYAHSIQERLDESIHALKKLRVLIDDLVPSVMLETPASIDENDFITKIN